MRATIPVMCTAVLLLTSCAAAPVPVSAVSSAPREASGADDGPAAPTSVAPPGAAQYVVWQGYQRPSSGGTERMDRIQEVPPVGPAEGRPIGQVMRFELRPGDRQTSSGYTANRVEVFSRHAESDLVPAEEWPDPPGSVRWYGFSLFVPEDFATTTDDKWLTLTQWKGANGGSPPLALEVKHESLRLGGERANSGLIPGDGLIGPLRKGSWTRLEIGIALSDDPASGWVEVWRDGALALPRTAVATMDVIRGRPDPIYLKQGIYRDSGWTSTHVLYFGPVKIGTTRERVT
jgi:hypothetical protein